MERQVNTVSARRKVLPSNLSLGLQVALLSHAINTLEEANKKKILKSVTTEVQALYTALVQVIESLMFTHMLIPHLL